jgi:hypothetical protein
MAPPRGNAAGPKKNVPVTVALQDMPALGNGRPHHLARAIPIADRGLERVRRFRARDRHILAIHEAGHFVVARHVGVRSPGAAIWESGLGRCSLEGATHIPPADLERLTDDQVVMIAVAGGVAEMWWANRFAPAIAGAKEFLVGSVASMSIGDWQFAPASPVAPHPQIVRAASAVGDLMRPDSGEAWADVVSVAVVLRIHGRVGCPVPRAAAAASIAP